MNWATRFSLISITVVGTAVSVACGGGEKTLPTPQATGTRPPVAPVATALPTATLAPRPIATSVPASIPGSTATPRPQSTPTSAPAQLGKLVFAVSSFGNEEIRPSRGAFTGLVNSFGSPIYDWMTWNNRDGTLAPGVLTRWQMSNDAKSWTITVREGMRFHNGDTLTADDVKFSFEQMLSDGASDPRASTNARAWFATVASVDVLSPTSVRVNVKQPWPLFPYEASPRSGSEGAIIPKAYFQSAGISGFETKPVGTGPWKMTGHDTAIRFKYEAPGLPHPYREAPRFKEMEILLVPEEATRMAMVKTGAADLVELGSFDNVADLKKREGFQVFEIPAITIGGMVLFGADDPRVQSMPTGKREVREAMQLAINRQELADTLFGGVAPVAARHYVAPGTLGYDPTWRPLEYNPSRAREILSRAGLSRGFPLTVYSYVVGGLPWQPRLAEAVAGYWSQIGIAVSLFPIDFVVIQTRYRARPLAQEIIGTAGPLGGATTLTNIQNLRTVFHSKGTTLLLNRPEMDDLLDRAAAEVDETKQVQLIRQIVELYTREHVAFPVAHVPTTFGVGPKIGAWSPITSTRVGTALETVTRR